MNPDQAKRPLTAVLFRAIAKSPGFDESMRNVERAAHDLARAVSEFRTRPTERRFEAVLACNAPLAKAIAGIGTAWSDAANSGDAPAGSE